MTNNPKVLFGKGIHSKRHIVHEPNGQIVGEWGLKVWGRPKSKQNRDAKRQNAHIQRQELRRIFYDQIENKEERIKWGHKLVCYDNYDHGAFDTCILAVPHRSPNLKNDEMRILLTVDIFWPLYWQFSFCGMSEGDIDERIQQQRA